jgi:PAS domain S-box-containing protein
MKDLYENETSSTVVQEKYKAFCHNISMALDNSCAGMLMLDKKGKILYANRAYETLSGFTGSELLGMTMRDLVKDRLYKQKKYPSAIEQRRTVYHNQIFNKTNSRIFVTCSPVINSRKEIEYVISNVQSMDGKAKNLDMLRLKERYIRMYNASQSYEDYPVLFDNQLVMNSLAMREVIDKVLKISSIDIDILLEGETGTGKSTLAKLIFRRSPRSRTGRFVEVNCGAIPYNLIESELFGYEKGSFTGANNCGKKGLFEEAHGGIIFLDEVEELAPDIQAKLLSVLQERRVRRIGSVESKKLDFQVIAASNRNLEDMVSQGKFRQDLYYRLNVVPIMMPPLRERREDIKPMVTSSLDIYNNMYGRNKSISPEVMNVFLSYGWPGNVRELVNLIKSLVIISKDDNIQLEDLPRSMKNAVMFGGIQNNSLLNLSLNDLVAELETELIKKALEQHGSMRKAAEALHITHSSLYRRMVKYRLCMPAGQ